MAEYYGVPRGELAHSKGKWKKHKYVRKEGNRYIYPEDLKKAASTASKIGNTVAKFSPAAQAGKFVGRAVGKSAKKEINRGVKKASSSFTSANIQYQSAKKDANDSVNRTKKGVSESAKRQKQRVVNKRNTIKKRAEDAYTEANINRLYAKKELKETNERVKKNAKAYAENKKNKTKKRIKKGRKQVAKYVYRKIAGE